MVLNDKGLNGDRVIGDDIWTAEIFSSGLEYGELPISVTVRDVFDATDSATENITVLNQAPRLTSIELVPSFVHREEMILVNAEVIDGHGVSSVSIDLRDYGSNITELNRLGEIWVGQIIVPSGMAPGDRILSVRMVDEMGSAIIVERTIASGQHHIETDMDEDILISVQNEAPLIEVGEKRVIEIGDEEVNYVLTVSVQDYDGLNWVKVKLGILAPPGQSNTWFTMTSNGDGTYSKEFTVKTYVALGTHEILIKARDSYGAQTGQEPLSIQLEAPDATSAAEEAENTLTFVALGGLGILAIIGAVIYVMRGSDKEGGLGGFGDA